ncbi:transmembrane protein 11, mitochondrial isoform X1 [Oryzias latipes]|uniref:transmembrane protein 11, mitochondrial isoform X1 n=1 Tax=Oryzias latipes TaxID=8090 RepID=UPI0005CBFD33|nr:transmembrane protein 11, mitochondrial isoform X1 [Oryzias latipes]
MSRERFTHAIFTKEIFLVLCVFRSDACVIHQAVTLLFLAQRRYYPEGVRLQQRQLASPHQRTEVQYGGVMAASDCYIVHEIYNGENAQDQFEYELEQALEAQYKYIVIEPTRIGDETARWITVGNCLHKTAVLSGSACLLTPLSLPAEYSRYVALPAGALSVACAALYGISWQFDPCCKYQVEYDSQKLSRLPLHTLTSSTPVVLVRRDDVHRKRLHNTIALAALAYCAKKIYELYAV